MAKISKARFGKASRAAHKAGKPGSNAYKAAFRRSLGLGASRAKTSIKRKASRIRSAPRRAARSIRAPHRTRRFGQALMNMNVRQGTELYIAGEGLVETAKLAVPLIKNAVNGSHIPTLSEVANTLAPAVDAGLAAQAFHTAATNPITAPPLVRRIMNMRPLKGDSNGLFKATVGEFVDGAPAVSGWVIGAQRYQSHKAIYAGSSINPRTAAMTGVQIQPSGGSYKLAFNRATVMDSAVAPVVIGGAVSKGVHMARTSGLVPAPAKRVFSIHG